MFSYCIDKRNTLLRHKTKKYKKVPLTKKTHIAIHHSATVTGSAEAYARWHVNKNDWPGIGYHFVIEQNGDVIWCNDVDTVSYHVGDSNGFAVGICLTGDFTQMEPTAEQWESLKKLVNDLKKYLNIPYTNIWGHQEFPGYSWKHCPALDMNAVREMFKSK